MAVRTSVVHGKVITTSPRRNVRDEDLLRIRPEAHRVDRAVEYRWRADATQP
jgi:hypothetical protein